MMLRRTSTKKGEAADIYQECAKDNNNLSKVFSERPVPHSGDYTYKHSVTDHDKQTVPLDYETLTVSASDTHTHFTQPIKPQVYQGTRRLTGDDEPAPEGPPCASRVREMLVSQRWHQQPLTTRTSSNR